MISESDADALSAGNDMFHEDYRGAREVVGQQVPILVVLPTELVLHSQGRRECVVYSRPSFARAKAAAHIAVALFTLTRREPSRADGRAGIEQLIRHISVAIERAPQSDPGRNDEVAALLQQCLRFAKSAFESPPTEEARAAFARDAGVRILRITDEATCEQVAGLHEAVESVFSRLSNRDRAELQVVVVGDHQARVRSLGMQYFKRRFREGEADVRVTYGENVDSEREAISLVATRRLDQHIALAFFGDERRLQRDVLGDAAKRCLDQMQFPT